MITFDQLHDASLLAIEVKWDSGELRCSLGVMKEERRTACLFAQGMKSLNCPRQFPWGRSVSINSVRSEEIEKGIRLIIEMQSGDVIEVHADKVILT